MNVEKNIKKGCFILALIGCAGIATIFAIFFLVIGKFSEPYNYVIAICASVAIFLDIYVILWLIRDTKKQLKKAA